MGIDDLISIHQYRSIIGARSALSTEHVVDTWRYLPKNIVSFTTLSVPIKSVL